MKTGKLLGVLCVIVLVLGIIASSCTQPAPTTTSPTTSPAAKTLKIALNIALNWPIGVDTQHAVTMDVDKINAAGGLTIGADKYKIDLIIDDNKMDEALAKTAAQKEISDGVKFIIGDLWSISYMSLVEQNKVILLAFPSSDALYDPKLQYVWKGTINDTNFPAVITYAAQKFPNLKKWVGVFPDDEQGHGYGVKHAEVAKNSGLTVLESVYYPTTATDLSAVGTRIKTLNPDFVSPHGGGPQKDSLALKAAYDAGWRGQPIGPATIPGQTMIGIAGAAPVEGMVSIGWPAEFEPAPYPLAAQFKADYKAKFGKWDDPEVVGVPPWYALKAALQKAGAPDPEKVKAVLDNGLKFESIHGLGQMIPRQDKGISRTVDMVFGDMPVKQMVGGQVKQIDTWTLEKVIELFKIGHAIK